MASLPVTFLFPEDEEALRDVDADRDWRIFCTGLWAWIAQTYLRLRDAGLPVRISSVPPRQGIVVYHPDYRGDGGREPDAADDTITVASRADRRPEDGADFEVVQNGCFVDGRRIVFLPHWPQPGLLRRHGSRGSRLETIAFKGHDAELKAGLRGEKWTRFVRDRGLRWIVDAASYRGPAADYSDVQWNDYREVDLVLAIRPVSRALSIGTPATKLQNAWAAGVPALLGPEYAYRELRRSELDYVEIQGVDEAIQAVQFLQNHPSAYQAIVENGLTRARDFTIAQIVDAWAALLFETIPATARGRRLRLRRRAPALLLRLHRRVRERVRGFRARLSLRRPYHPSKSQQRSSQSTPSATTAPR